MTANRVANYCLFWMLLLFKLQQEGLLMMKHLRTLTLINDVAATGSIRRTAERRNITPSALTRKIQDFERELGVPIFERLPQGMRLNAAGEFLIRYVRNQVSDFERLKSQIADLSGVRRGHVAIACSQAFVDHLLPSEVAAYRAKFPQVSFMIQMRDHTWGISALRDFEADLALLINPPPFADIQVLHAGSQPLCALMHRSHPLAGEGPIRLRDCFRHPVAMPDGSLAIRRLLDDALARKQMPMDMQIESNSLEFQRNYASREPMLSFQVSVGIPVDTPDLCARPVHEMDMPPVEIALAQLLGRTLSVAAAKFVDQLLKNPVWG
jgi:DNA-binding transcriptional LysR family regulator